MSHAPPPRRGMRPDAVSEELAFHLEERIEELIASGLPRPEAEREARRRFGNPERVERAVRRVDRDQTVRDGVTRMFRGWGREVRLAFRTLRKHPGYTVAALGTLALGLGANTAVFSAIRGVLLVPLDAPHLNRIVVIRQDVPGLHLTGTQMSVPEVRDLGEHDEAFEAVGGAAGGTFTLGGGPEPERVLGVRTVGRLFDVLGTTPFLGRFYSQDAGENGGQRVVVLTHGLWQRWFGGDTAAVGRMLELDGTQYEVVGVLPPTFRYRPTVQLYVPYPITPSVLQQRASWSTTPMAIRRADITAAQLPARLAAITEEWQRDPAKAYPPELQRSLETVSYTAWQAGELQPVLWLLFGAVLVVQLIACSNVANLQLIRAVGREREYSVRAAIGAGRGQLMRTAMVESLVLTVGGGLAGLGLAWLLVRWVAGLESVTYLSLRTLQLDPVVLGFAAVSAAVTALLFGTYPAVRAARARLTASLSDGARTATAGPGRTRLLRTTVAVQVALSLVLLLGAGILIRSLGRILATDPGFRPAQVLTFRVSLPAASYAGPQRAVFFDALLARLQNVPGVGAVGGISDLPFGAGRNSSPYQIVGRPDAPGQPPRHADMRFVHGDYFQVMGIPVRQGRAFTAEDAGDGATSIVIDETLANEAFPGENPIGHRLNQGPEGTIVGVVGAIKHGDLREDNKATIYYAYDQAPFYAGLYLTVRTSTPDAILPLVRAAVRNLDPTLPVYDIRPMQERIDLSLGTRRFGLTVLSGFAVLALLLALVGVYGVLSYSLRQRTHELGIRLALGAIPRDLRRMVLQQGLGVTGIGLVSGIAVFLLLARLLGALVYGVSVRDPVALAGAVALLAAGATVAAWLPARRAGRVHPAQVLREP